MKTTSQRPRAFYFADRALAVQNSLAISSDIDISIAIGIGATLNAVHPPRTTLCPRFEGSTSDVVANRDRAEGCILCNKSIAGVVPLFATDVMSVRKAPSLESPPGSSRTNLCKGRFHDPATIRMSAQNQFCYISCRYPSWKARINIIHLFLNFDLNFLSSINYSRRNAVD
jgi:hypothetical protein